MSIRTRIASALLRGNPLENPSVPLSSGAAWLYDLFGGSPTSAGEAINEQTAMQCDAVYSSINVIASDAASLPFKVYEATDKGDKPAVDHDLYDLLAVEPNPEMTPPVFLSTWLGCALLGGNGYVEIQRDGNKPAALWPLHPRLVKPVRAKGSEPLTTGVMAKAGDLTFQVTVNNVVRYVAAKDMLHLPGLSLDGWTGLSPVHAAKQTIGTAKAAGKFIGGFFGRGSRPSGLLTGPTEAGLKTGDPRMDQARKSWEAANSGDNQGRTAVMPNGWTWTAIGLSPEQAQFLAISQFTRSQIAGLFRVPPHMIGDTSRLSNSNHESQSLEYVTYTLRPWLVKIEAEVQRKLMPRVGRSANKLTVRFDFSELIRGDFASQMSGFATGRQWGFYSTNDIRRKLGENPIGPAGDIYLAPLNMVPLDKIAAEPTPSPQQGEGGDSDADPAGNGGQNQQRLLERMGEAFGGLFRDAVGRMCTRNTREDGDVAQLFTPVLDAIASEAKRQAVSTFRVKPDADLGAEKILRDYRKALQKRCADWKPVTADADSAAELARAVRSITLGIFREAGASAAMAA